MTAWHITFGTYGARLHGALQSTVDRQHNDIGQPFLGVDIARESCERSQMGRPPLLLSLDQRLFIQISLPSICERGGWTLLASAAERNHVHSLIRANPSVHGKQIRSLVKRWLTQSLNDRWSVQKRWWAEGGSTKAVKDKAYIDATIAYIDRQRAVGIVSGIRGVDAPARGVE